MLTEYAFWFLTFVAIFSSIGMILSKNPVYSVLSLIVTFFAIAGHYFLMNAQFLAAVHIIVYSGAIMVLFLYVVMMLNLNNLQEERKSFWIKVLGIVSAWMLMFVLIGVLRRTDELNAITPAPDSANIGLTKQLGLTLYREFLLPFELASVLFLAAMVGAVYLTKKDRESVLTQNA